jgi:tetratricopeptide (TPR) repeat protein/adenylate kinase family enzyme
MSDVSTWITSYLAALHALPVSDTGRGSLSLTLQTISNDRGRQQPLTLRHAFEQHSRLLLIGPAGSGKTTMMVQLAQQLAEQATGDTRAAKHKASTYLPIYIDLRQFVDSLEQTIQTMYGGGVPPAWRELGGRSLVVLVDGLEQLPHDVQLMALSHLSSVMNTLGAQARWILSCRSEALSLFRSWFNSAEVRAIRPLPATDVLSYVRAHCSDAFADVIAQDDTILALAGRPRWLDALVDAYQQTKSPTQIVIRSGWLWDWFDHILNRLNADSNGAEQLLLTLHSHFTDSNDDWALVDVVQQLRTAVSSNAVIAHQLLGAPASDADIVALQSLMNAGLLQFDYEQQLVSYRHAMVRSAVRARVWLQKNPADWTVTQIAGDDDALAVALDLAEKRPQVIKRLLELGMTRPAVKAIIHGPHAGQVKSLLQSAGVSSASARMDIAEILQAEGAYAQARQQLEGITGDQRNDSTVIRRIAELAMLQEDWPAAVQAYEYVSRLQPDDLHSRTQLAVAYGKMGSLDAATGSLKNLLNTYRRHGATVAKELGNLYVRQQDYPAALDAFNEAMRDVQDDPALYRAKGHVLETLGRVTEAHDLLQAALKSVGDHPDILVALARTSLRRNERTAAKSYIDKAIQQAPFDATNHAILARVRMANGDGVGAWAAAQRAVELQPHDDQLYIELGEISQQHGEIDAAIAAYQKAIELTPTNIDAQRALAKLLQQRGHNDEAVQVVSKGLIQRPNEAVLHGDLAALLWSRGDYDGALTTYRRAIALAPYDSTYVHAMAKSLVEAGRYREATDAYNKAIGIDSDNIDLLVDAVALYKRLGLLEQGEAIVQRGLIHHTSNPTLLRTAAQVSLARGESKRARQYLSKAVRHDRHDEQTWLAVAQLHIAEKKWSKSLFALQRIIDIATNPLVLTALGQALAGAGRIAEAISSFVQSLNAKPDSIETLLAYSSTLASQQRYDEAYDLAHKAHTIDATNVDVMVQLAQLSVQTNRADQATELLQNAARLAPQRIDVQCALGKFMYDQGLFSEAWQIAQQALGLDGSSVHALVIAADALRALNRMGEAHDLYQQAYGLDATNEGVLAGLRDVALHFNDLSQAADAAQRLVNLLPKSAVHHLRFGEVLTAMGVPEAAIIEFQQVLEIARTAPQSKNTTQPVMAQAYAQMSKAYAKSARWSEARECAEQAVAHDAEHGENHALLGEALLGLGLRSAAVGSYRKAVHQRPNNAAWQYTLGSLLYQTGSHQDAVSALQKAVELNGSAEYYHTLGRSYLALGHSKQAIMAFEKALQKRPEAHHWRADLADVHVARGRHHEAVAEIDRALEVAADHPVLWRKRAELQLSQNNPEQAADDVIEALRRDANDVDALILLSQIMQRQDNLPRALEAAERAVKYHSTNGEARYQLAKVLRLLHRPREVIPHMLVALRSHDHRADWWVTFAEDYERVNDAIHAAQCMERAVELEPNDVSLVYRLGVLLLQAEEYDAAEQELRYVIAKHATAADAISALAEVMLAKQHIAEAATFAQQAVDLQGDVSEHWRVLSRVLRAQGTLSDALQAARKAHELDRDYGPSALSYGVLLLDNDHIDEAVQVFTRAVASDDTVAVYHLCLGMALRQKVPLPRDLDAFTRNTPDQQVKLMAALQSFERALMIEGDHPRGIFERGVVLQMLGRHDEAVDSFDAAAALQGDVNPRPLSGDAVDASMIAKNDLAAHIRQRRALSLAMRERYTEAIDDMRYVLAGAPLSVYDQYTYGRIAFLAGDITTAESALKVAAAALPAHAGVQQWYGRLLMKLDRVKEAIVALEQAQELVPESGPLSAMLRNAYLADDRIDRAISAAQRATRHDPNNPENHYELARLYMQTSRMREARASVIAAITLKGDMVDWHMLLGDACMQLGMFDNARSAYLSASNVDPESTAPLYALSRLLVLIGRVQEAITNLEQAIQRNPNNPDWHLELAQHYENVGNREGAHRAYKDAVRYGNDKAVYTRALTKFESKYLAKEKAIEKEPAVATAFDERIAIPVIDPRDIPQIDTEPVDEPAHPPVKAPVVFSSDVERYLTLGDVNAVQEMYASAIEDYQSALAIDPFNVAALARLGQVYMTMGNEGEAYKSFTAAISHDRNCVEAHAGLAKIASKREEWGDAFEHLRLVMYIEPHVVSHRIALADVLHSLHRTDEARDLLVQMMTHLPADVEQLHLFAEIASKLNLRDEAVEAAEQAVRLDGTNAESFMVLGRIQHKFKNYSNALWAFQQAIKYDPSRKEAQQMIAHLGPLSFWRKHMGNKSRTKSK